MEEKILQYIKTHGPSTEIEVAAGVGTNSMVASAILATLHNTKKISQSKKRLGSVRVYFMPNQLQQARKRVLKGLDPGEINILKELQQKGKILPGQYPDSVLEEFGDFLIASSHNGQRAWEWFEGAGKGKPVSAPTESVPQAEQTPGQRALDRLARWKSEVTQVKPKDLAQQAEVQESVPAPKQPQFTRVEASPKAKPKVSQPKKAPDIFKVEKAKEGNYSDLVSQWVTGLGGEIKSVEQDGKKQWLLDALVPTPLGKQQYLVIAIQEKKKKVGVTGVSKAFNKAIREKTPIILVSATGFAKAAETFWKKEYKGMITLVDGKNI